MRVMLDTNVLVSAALFPNSKTSTALSRILREHTPVVCTHVLEELHEVVAEKFPHKTSQVEQFLSTMAYELCYTPKANPNTPDMRDEDDRPILQAAIDQDVDAIVTGDLDFHALDIERPLILSPSDFL